jgi:cytochrome P450
MSSYSEELWIGEGPEPCNKDAWIPFLIGAYSCVGKPLAMMEPHVITATVVRNFDIFAKGFDPAKFESSVTNDFMMTPPSVAVVLSPAHENHVGWRVTRYKI